MHLDFKTNIKFCNVKYYIRDFNIIIHEIYVNPSDVRFRRMANLGKHRSKQKGWDHDIDYEWIRDNITDKCPKCGVEYSYDLDIKMNPFAPSLDRIDPTKGYTKENCIITSWIYNCGKNAYNEETLYIICKAFLKLEPFYCLQIELIQLEKNSVECLSHL